MNNKINIWDSLSCVSSTVLVSAPLCLPEGGPFRRMGTVSADQLKIGVVFICFWSSCGPWRAVSSNVACGDMKSGSEEAAWSPGSRLWSDL